MEGNSVLIIIVLIIFAFSMPSVFYSKIKQFLQKVLSNKGGGDDGIGPMAPI